MPIHVDNLIVEMSGYRINRRKLGDRRFAVLYREEPMYKPGAALSLCIKGRKLKAES